VTDRPVRLAFCGASGTGKSTLVQDILRNFLPNELPMCPTGSREIAKAMGFDNPYDVDAAGKRAEFQQRLLAAKSLWEADHESFITDRTHFDNLTYTSIHAPELASDKVFRAAVLDAMTVYTHIVFCPINAFHNLANDPARVTGAEYHHRYETILVDMLLRYMTAAPILWLNTSIQHDRVLQVVKFAWS
jgi:GTPase SAR1 family protein